MPKLTDFNFTQQEVDKEKDERQYLDMKGGEDAGLKRANYYLTGSKKLLNKYNDTRNGLGGADYSSKMSAWMSAGCVSPRYMFWRSREFEAKHGRNESTKCYIDELLWRDFARYWCMRYGTVVFSKYGIYNRTYWNWQNNQQIIERWRQGQTGMPLIDALMREMNTTGFMGNRGRQIVACYLTQDL